jgi:serine/threonine-protein kinase
MNEPHDPSRREDVPSTPADSLDAGLAAGFGKQAPRSSLDASQRPVLLPQAEDATGDRYQLFGEIARGGMGAVLRGRDVDLGRDLAVKVLLFEYADRPDLVRRFIEEAQIGGQLQHPGVVPVYDMGRFGERPFFTMKLVKGHTLAALLDERADPSVDRPRFLGIALQVAQALAYAHAKGVIHRDLKPSNIMVGAFGEVQVMDWGLAKVLPEEWASRERERPEETTIRTARSSGSGWGTDTEAGSLLGTPAYIPPEQANGDVANLDRRADVFGFGAILCEILTGQPPYVGLSAEEVRRKAANGDLADALTRLDGCGADQELIVLTKKCLSPKASDRPKDAQAVADALTAYLDGVQERLHQAELAEAAARARAVEEVRRRRLTLALAATVLLALTLGGGGWLWRKNEQQVRVAQVARDVNEALNRATALHEQARVATTGGAALFAQAREQTQRALALAESGPTDETLKQQVRNLQAKLDEEAKDRKLLFALDEARLAQAEIAEGSGRYARERAVPLFREALRAYGMPPGEGDPAAVAARIRQRPAPVREGLLAALDEWIDLAIPAYAIVEPHRDWLRSVRAAAEPRDRWTRRVRKALEETEPRGVQEALAEKDVVKRRAALEEFAKAAVKRRAALEKLAEEADVQTVPAPSLTRLGFWLLSVGADKSAARLLRRAREKYPANFWVNHNLGGVLKGLTPPELDESVRFLSVAVALRPESSGAHSDLGAALYQKSKVDEAIACYRKAIELDRKFALAHYNLGIALKRQGKVDQAIACYKQAIALDPKHVGAHINLGNALTEKGNLDEAIKWHEKAIALDPSSAAAHANLGLALEDKGKPNEAIQRYHQAIALDLRYAPAHAYLGWALKHKGKFDAAVACLRQAIKLDPNFAIAHSNLGVILCDVKHDYDGAIARFRKAIAIDRNYAQAHFNLGNALRHKGNLDEAIKYYLEAIAINSKYANAHFHLGLALADKGKLDDAITHLRKTIALDGKKAGAHARLGGILCEAKHDYDRAITCFRKAIVIDPKNAPHHYNLGLTLWGSGRYAQARTAVDQAWALLPTNHPLQPLALRLSRACRRLQELEPRLPRFLDGQDQPASASESVDLARLCGHKKRHAAAVRFWTTGFALDEKLADDVIVGRRSSAACSAALAAAGAGEDAGKLDDKERSRLRKQALDWLRAYLAQLTELIAGGPPAARPFVHQTVQRWQQDSDLAGIRDKAALDKLPAEEQKAFTQLWIDVAALRKKAEEKAK